MEFYFFEEISLIVFEHFLKVSIVKSVLTIRSTLRSVDVLSYELFHKQKKWTKMSKSSRFCVTFLGWFSISFF